MAQHDPEGAAEDLAARDGMQGITAVPSQPADPVFTDLKGRQGMAEVD